MFRVVALGYRAGMIVDRLRAIKNYEDIRFLDLILSRPCKDHSSERNELPFGVVATDEQLLMAFNTMYSNNMPEYYKAGTFSFHENTHRY